MENTTKQQNPLKMTGLIILAAGLAFLAYKCYAYRYFFFDLPKPDWDLVDYYTAMYMKEYLAANPGNTMKFVFQALGFWQPLAVIASGLVLTVIGKTKDQ